MAWVCRHSSGWCNEYNSAETGLYYLGSRYYDPEVGRFINADSVVAGASNSIKGNNLFEYCNNNPVNLDDPNGNWPKWLHSIKKKAVKLLETAGKSLSSELGVGVGIGGTAKVKLYGLNAAVSGVAKVDAVNIRTAEGNYKIGTKYDANLGIEIGPLKNYMGTTAFHSYNEKDCTCSWEKPIYDIYNCKNTIKEPINTSNTIGLDLSAYLGIGFTASLEFNLDYFVENTIKIFSED